jgi:hypothetical protein
VFFHPGEECGAEVEAHFLIVIDDFEDSSVGVEYAGGGVLGVTFGVNSFVPVVVWVGGVLDFDFFQPGIFSGRLVKVTVYANVIIHEIDFPPGSNRE